MRRFLATLPVLLLLWAILAGLNHAISPWHVHVFAGALYVTYAALAYPLREGMAASFVGGLVVDASTPLPFGTHALLFATAHALLHHLRDRLPRDDTAGRVVIALMANFGLFLAVSLVAGGRAPPPADAWPCLLLDLVCSQAAVALAAPWFFALQGRVLVLAAAEPEPIG